MAALANGMTKDENAAELELGEAFNGEVALSNAEVAVLLHGRKTQDEAGHGEMDEIFQKTYEYVMKFSGLEAVDPEQSRPTVEST